MKRIREKELPDCQNLRSYRGRKRYLFIKILFAYVYSVEFFRSGLSSNPNGFSTSKATLEPLIGMYGVRSGFHPWVEIGYNKSNYI